MLKEEELEKILLRSKELEDLMSQASGDNEQFVRISKEYSDLKPIVDNIDEDELLLDDTSDSIPDELDETLLEEDEEDTVSLEEITDVSSPNEES